MTQPKTCPLPATSLKVAVVDYESGNLRSVTRALERTGVELEVTGDPGTLLAAQAAVLPGVGSGDAAMRSLRSRGLVDPIREFAASGRPFLGVCLGLQLLMDSTEEGETECLGIIPGRTRKLPPGLKVPHMGWNGVHLATDHPVFQGIDQDSHFYFVHSYYADPLDRDVVAGVTDYGIPFCSALVQGRLVATQFHPEKSSALGLRIYENFVRYARGVAL
jgi:glutamine amidotransferase